jgi:hypothetical protein
MIEVVSFHVEQYVDWTADVAIGVNMHMEQ